MSTRDRPVVALEEYDGARVVMRVQATPLARHEGSRLAGEVLALVDRLATSEVEIEAAAEAPVDPAGTS